MVAIDSDSGMSLPNFDRQTSSLSSLSADSGFPMSCRSPSPSNDVPCFDDIGRKFGQVRSTVKSPTSPTRHTSGRSLPSSKRYVSVLTSEQIYNTNIPESESLSTSCLAPRESVDEHTSRAQQRDLSPSLTLHYKNHSIDQECVNEGRYGHMNLNKRSPLQTVSSNVLKEIPISKQLERSSSDSHNLEHPLQTSSLRVSRSSAHSGFPAVFRKPHVSSSPRILDTTRTGNHDTMTALASAKNAVGIKRANYSDVDTVKVSGPQQCNPLLFEKRPVQSNPGLDESTSKCAGQDYVKSGQIRKGQTGDGDTRYRPTGYKTDGQVKLPFTITKLEDDSKTVRKRIPSGMVANMKQMFSEPIKNRESVSFLTKGKKYGGVQQTDEFACDTVMGATPAIPDIYDFTPETSDRCVDSMRTDGDVSKGEGHGSDKHDSTNPAQRYSPDVETSELDVCLQDGGVVTGNEYDDSNYDDDADDNIDEIFNAQVMDDTILDDSDEGNDYNVYANKDDIKFRVRRADDPPSTLTTTSYIDNILRLRGCSLNSENKESATTKIMCTNKECHQTDNSMKRSLVKRRNEICPSDEDIFDRVEMTMLDKKEEDSNVKRDIRPEYSPVVSPIRGVNMYSVINNYSDSDTRGHHSNLCTCIWLRGESHDNDDNGNTHRRGVCVQCDGKNVLHRDSAGDSHSVPEAISGKGECKGNSRLKTDKKNEQIHKKGGIYRSNIAISPVAIGNKCTDGQLSINNTTTRPYVTFDKPGADDKLTEACPTPGDRDKLDDDHVAFISNTSPQVESKHVSTLTAADVVSECSPSTSSDHRSSGVHATANMPERSAGHNNNFCELSEYSGGTKFSTKSSTTDINMNERPEEAKKTLSLLAEAMSKLNGNNNDDILPDIKQSVTKLDGGNLVITTLTRKITEEEEEEVSSGRGTPIPDYNDVFYVRDHRGNIYAVEDITEDSQESAYYSSSMVSQENDYNRIHNLQSIGRSTIDHDTAEEVLLGLYNQGGSTVQIEEIDENERQLVVHQGDMDAMNQFSADSSFNRQSTKYDYDTVDGEQRQAQAGPRSTSTVKTIKQCYEMTSANPSGRDGKDGYPEEDIKMETEETKTIRNMDNSGCKTMSSSFRYQTDASLLPPVVPETTVYAMPPPPMILPPVQTKLVQLDMTPVPPCMEMVQLVSTVPVTTTKVTESKTDRIVTSTEDDNSKMKLSEHGRPVYKSVALVKGPYETPKWQITKHKEEKAEEDDAKRYRIVNSHASKETQQREMVFDTSSSSLFHSARRANFGMDENQHMYHTENVIQMNGGPIVEPQIHRTRIDVSSPPLPRMNYGNHGGDAYEYEESKKYITTQKFQSESAIPVGVPSPPRLPASSAERDMRVVRGNILIKNTMDQGLDEFDDNINMFSKGFNMCKQNPMYQSDEDVHKRTQEDVAFETSDRYTRTKQGEYCRANALFIINSIYHKTSEI